MLAACVTLEAWHACVLGIRNVKSKGSKVTHDAEGLGEPDSEHG